MFSLRAKLAENLVLFVLASFAFMSIFGVGIGMTVKDGQMSSCPFMASEASMCQMGATEHISQWQRALLGIPKGDFLALEVLLFAIVLIPFAKTFFKLEKLTEFTAQLFAHEKAHPLKVFDPLLLAFSGGILNPKIYEPAHS